MRKCFAYSLLLVVLLSCGTTRRTPAPTAAELPLEDPVAIAQSRQRAQEVMDSIQRVRPSEPDSLRQSASSAAPQTASQPVAQTRELALSDQVIAYARSFTGTPYKLGARGPKQFDCSGFTSFVFKHFGYTITPFSQAQFREGREVASYFDLQKGDLVFFGKRAGVREIGHVGIVVSVDHEKGSFTFIHASVSNGVVEQTSSHPYFMMRYIGARRVLPDE